MRLNKIIFVSSYFLIIILSSVKVCRAEGLVVEVRPEISAVVASVVNRSSQIQTIAPMDCSWWDNWIFDNPRIAINIGLRGCLKNVAYERVLKPGEKYTHKISLRIPYNWSELNSSFRVGFKWNENEFSKEAHYDKNGKFIFPEEKIRVIWSDPISLYRLYPWGSLEFWICLFGVILGIFLCKRGANKGAGALLIIISTITIFYLLRSFIFNLCLSLLTPR